MVATSSTTNPVLSKTCNVTNPLMSVPSLTVLVAVEEGRALVVLVVGISVVLVGTAIVVAMATAVVTDKDDTTLL